MYNRYSDTRSSMAPKRENELTLEVLCRHAQERMITQMTFAQTVLLYIFFWRASLRAVIGQVECLARETCIAKSTFRYLQFLVCGGPEYVKGCWFSSAMWNVSSATSKFLCCMHTEACVLAATLCLCRLHLRVGIARKIWNCVFHSWISLFFSCSFL